MLLASKVAPNVMFGQLNPFVTQFAADCRVMESRRAILDNLQEDGYHQNSLF